MNHADFEYIDKSGIDKDLYCDFCANPLVDPVSTPCRHTFCRRCIETKINKTGGACAKSKCKNKSIALEDLTPVTERIVLNMLDRILVKCLNCGASNIQRGAFDKHATKFCPKATVSCSAVDLKCSWTGTSDQLKQHRHVCSYEHLRPILSEIIHENQQFKDELHHRSEQCSTNHCLQMKQLQEVNQCLNMNVNQINEILAEQVNQLTSLQNEIQQLKELTMHNRTQIQELQHEKSKIRRIEERCSKNDIQIHHLIDKLNQRRGLFDVLTRYLFIYLSFFLLETHAYENTQLELNISKYQFHTAVDLSKQQLLDRDMETIIKQAVIGKECTRLDLGYNMITSQGVSILVDALKQNTTLEELDFHNNRVSDLGVHSIAEVLSTNKPIIKALGLGSNGITDKGAEHLAEMLKTNRTVTWLALAGNQIGDYGVKLLAKTLAHENSSLTVLSLHVNKLISDASVDTIIYMLQHNKSLRKLWMQDCNLSEEGKSKLRDAAKLRQNFLLYM